jgi:hypothetical protein
MENDIDLSGMLMNFDFRKKISDNVTSNKIINNYYNTLRTEYRDNFKMYKCISNKILRFQDCNQYWDLDYYKFQNVKIFNKTEYCKDKFCLNCKKWRQAQRMKKFLPELAKYDEDLYFVTFTVPNVNAIDVKPTIKRIFDAHRNLTRYLDGTKKTKLVDFPSMFNFIGGIRVLEISINRDRKNKYHVHLHCAYVFDGYKEPVPKTINRFSEDHHGKRKYLRKFTLHEVYLQKFWFLMYEDINLKKCDTIHTFNAINTLTNREKNFNNKGYSVTIDKFKPGEYFEMFKYMIKDSASYTDKDGNTKQEILNYDEFKTLYFSTANVRQLECYGVFKNLSDDEDLINEDEVNDIFNVLKNFLDDYEPLENIIETPIETLKSDSVYLSKSKLFTYFRKLQLEEFKDKPFDLPKNRLDSELYQYYKYLIKDMKLDSDSRKKNTTSANKVVSIVKL